MQYQLPEIHYIFMLECFTNTINTKETEGLSSQKIANY
jgi:hypothetical protein